MFLISTSQSHLFIYFCFILLVLCSFGLTLISPIKVSIYNLLLLCYYFFFFGTIVMLLLNIAKEKRHDFLGGGFFLVEFLYGTNLVH